MTKFEEWLEKEYPAHDVYDFDTLFQYERWIDNLRKAYEAGYAEGFNQGIKDGSDYAEHYKVI